MRDAVGGCLEGGTDLQRNFSVSKIPLGVLRTEQSMPYDNEDHGDPHGQSAARLLAEYEREDAAGETSEIVDAHDDTF